MIKIIKAEARNHWPIILEHFGINVRNDGKHGPCPKCGGKDRFRFDDKDGHGTWYCNQDCYNGKGYGDGFDLVSNCMNLSIVEAIIKVADYLGVKYDKAHISKAKDKKPDWLKYLKNSQEISENDPAGIYLVSRGLWIPEAKNVLRYHAGLYEISSKKKRPCLIAIFKKNGKACGLHRIWPAWDKYEKVKRFAKGGDHQGSAVEIMAVQDHELGVAEGVETAMACCKLFGIPTWATGSTSGMKSFFPPKNIKLLHIFGDHDKNYAGHLAAYGLAARLSREAPWVKVRFYFPCSPGMDWLDIYYNFHRGKRIMNPEKIVRPWVEKLCKAKTRKQINEIGKEAKIKIKESWIREDFLEMARKRWHQLDA